MRHPFRAELSKPDDAPPDWYPLLYFQWAHGSFASVDQTGSVLVCSKTSRCTQDELTTGRHRYYLPRNNSADQFPVEAFPVRQPCTRHIEKSNFVFLNDRMG